MMSECESLIVSVVSYINSYPFIYGLKKWKGSIPIVLQIDQPSVCAQKLIDGKADVGLVPVAVLPEISNGKIISDYCIGADGPVTSVLLVSMVPLNEIETILLDYQSRTSVMLTKILAKKFWNIEVEWEATQPNYEQQISGTKAGVIIGDRALLMRNQFPYVYDLSDEWKKMTGLPFVFAVWVGPKNVSQAFLTDFNLALKEGFDNLDKVIQETENTTLNLSDITDYLKVRIDYRFDVKKQEAMTLFLTLMKEV